MECFKDNCKDDAQTCENVVTNENNDILQKAIYIYTFVVILTWLILILFVGIKGWSAFIVGIVFGQVVLYFICFPTKIDVYSEFSSWSAIYTFITLLTPAIVYIYAVFVAWSDRGGCSKNPIGVKFFKKGLNEAVGIFSPKKK